MVDIILYGIGFLLMVLIQALVINGIHECFQGGAMKDELSGKTHYQGMVFYMLAPKFFERNKYKSWSKPFFSCVRCMASIYSLITYWPLIIYLFGFTIIEVPIFIADMFCVSIIAWLIYKKI
jgi:hypothetical protein